MAIVDVPIGDGKSFLVKIDEETIPEDFKQRNILPGSTETIENFFGIEEDKVSIDEDIKNAIEYLYSTFDSLIQKPDSIQLEFGVEIGIGTDGLLEAILGSIKGNAHITVTATWTKPAPTEPAPKGLGIVE